MDPDQTAPIGAVCSGTTLLEQEAPKTFRQTANLDEICCVWALKAKISSLLIMYLSYLFLQQCLETDHP